MSKFRKKPIVIEAIQFIGGNASASEIQDWAREYEVHIVWFFNHDALSIPTLEGSMSAVPNDWIIKGVRDEFYPCKPDIFEATYETIDDAEYSACLYQ